MPYMPSGRWESESWARPTKAPKNKAESWFLPHQAEIDGEEQRHFQKFGVGNQPRDVDLGDDGDQGDDEQRQHLEAAEPVVPSRFCK